MTEVAASALLVGALLVALVVQPAWPAALVTGLLWLGGSWRVVALPAALTLLAAVLVANTRQPGRADATARAIGARVLARLPVVAAALLGAAVIGHNLGLLSFGSAARALTFLAAQIALFPHSPTIALLLLGATAALWADARGVRALPWLHARWQERPRRPEQRLRQAWPGLAAAAAAGLLAAAIFPAAMQAWGRAEGRDAQRFNFYTSFFNFAFEDAAVVSREGYGLGLRGLTLPPGGHGSIVFQLERTPESRVLLKPNFYRQQVDEMGAVEGGATFRNRLGISTDQGRSYQTLLRDTSVGQVFGGAVLDLTPFLRDSRTYWLDFEADNTTKQEVTVLPSITVSAVVDPLALPDPLFPLVPYAMVSAALVFLAARASSQSGRRAALAGVAYVALGLLVVALGAESASGGGAITDLEPQAFANPAAQSGVLWVLGVARAATALAAALVVLAAARRRVALPDRRVPWMVVACLLVSVVALDARWQALMPVRYEKLLPDAQGYQAIGAEFPDKMAHYRAERYSELLDQLYAAGFEGKASAAAVFYAGGNNGREPLWPATLRVVYNVLGVSAFHTRLTSLGLSVVAAGLTCWLGWRLLHPIVGVVAGLLYAFSGPQIENSIQGLREELVGVIFLLLIAAIFLVGRRRPSYWRLAAVGLAGGALVLVRSDMLVLSGMVITLGALALRWPWQRWLVAVAVIGLLSGPMYVGYRFTHGDAFYPGTYGATVNRNLEFPERVGTPGFPTKQEYQANWAAGPKISPAQYFFGYHPPGQFLEYMARGFVRIFPGILFAGQRTLLGQPWEVWPLVGGAIALLLRRRWLVPAAVVVGLVPFYAFLAGVPSPWVFAPRYAHHVLPLTEMAAAYGLCLIPILYWERRAEAAPGFVS